MPIISIENEKKRRIRKRIVSQLTFVLVLIVIVTIVVYSLLTSKFSELAHSIKTLTTTESFPIVAKQHQLKEIQPIDNALVVLTKASVFFYDYKGNVISEITHGFSNPVIKTAGIYCIVYDRGGVSYKMASPYHSYIEEKTDGKILSANITKSGRVAVAQLHPRYSSLVTVKERSGSKIYEWYSAHDKLVDLTFNQSGSGLHVATVIPSKGLLSTVIYELDFKSKDEVYKTQILDSVPFSVISKSNGKVCVVGNKDVTTIDGKGTIISQYFPYTPIAGYLLTQTNTFLIVKNLTNNNHTLQVLNRDGVLDSSINLSDKQFRSEYVDGKVYLLANDKLYIYNIGSKEMKKEKLEKTYKDLAVVQGNVYLLDDNEVIKIRV